MCICVYCSQGRIKPPRPPDFSGVDTLMPMSIYLEYGISFITDFYNDLYLCHI